jgi:putative ABC transport system substrate-binding protein
LPDGTERTFESLAEDVARWKPDAIQVRGAASARAAQKALPAIPVIFSGVADPVAEGLVASQAKPGKNLTGVSQSFEGLEPKLLEVLREMNPGSRKIAVVYDSVTNPVDRTLAHLRAAAATLRFAIEEHDAAGPEGFPKALAAAALTRPDALLPAGMISDTRYYEKLIAFQDGSGIPVFDNELESTRRGGSLVSIGEDVSDVYRRKAEVTVQILLGGGAGRPADPRQTRGQQERGAETWHHDSAIGPRACRPCGRVTVSRRGQPTRTRCRNRSRPCG